MSWVSDYSVQNFPRTLASAVHKYPVRPGLTDFQIGLVLRCWHTVDS